ncbi:MAG: MOSC domain-containing protein [Oculatellaceae cyanobacterium bins.114]|nr:MOSC domain-containing protein [Oculatellaceae cyanobacterium bins.114]
MQIAQLLIKPSLGKAMCPCETLELRRGYGIADDANAVIGSPRQILLLDALTLDRFELKPGQLRENIVLAGMEHPFQSGQVLQLGSTALVRLTTSCEPCAFLNQIRPGLAQTIRHDRGFLGMVIKSGQIRIGDWVALTAHQLPVIPETTRGKFDEFIARIPIGKVVSTPNLLLALGLTQSYYRTIPALLKKSPMHLPVHRIVAADGSLMTKHIPDQCRALQAEGVKVMHNRVSPDYFWEAIAFHELGDF